MSSTASQEFRDGAATGAILLSRRIRRLESWGVTVVGSDVERLAIGVVDEYGGAVSLDEDAS